MLIGRSNVTILNIYWVWGFRYNSRHFSCMDSFSFHCPVRKILLWSSFDIWEDGGMPYPGQWVVGLGIKLPPEPVPFGPALYLVLTTHWQFKQIPIFRILPASWTAGLPTNTGSLQWWVAIKSGKLFPERWAGPPTALRCWGIPK